MDVLKAYLTLFLYYIRRPSAKFVVTSRNKASKDTFLTGYSIEAMNVASAAFKSSIALHLLRSCFRVCE